jgi:hypothetical protein
MSAQNLEQDWPCFPDQSILETVQAAWLRMLALGSQARPAVAAEGVGTRR